MTALATSPTLTPLQATVTAPPPRALTRRQRWLAVTAATACWLTTGLTIAHALHGTRLPYLIIAVTVSSTFLITGALLLRTSDGRYTGGYVLAVGALWPLHLGATGPQGYYPLLAYATSTIVWTLLIPAVLTYPAHIRRTRPERRFLITQASTLIGMAIALAVLGRPDWNGLTPHARWPSLLADRAVFNILTGIYAVACVTLALGVAALLRQRTIAAVGLDKKLIPAAVGCVAAGLTAAIASAVTTMWGSPNVWANAISVQGIALLALPVTAALALHSLRRTAPAVLTSLRPGASPQDIEAALRKGLGDDSIVMYLPGPGGPHGDTPLKAIPWVDSGGRAAAPHLLNTNSKPYEIDGAHGDAPVLLYLGASAEHHATTIKAALHAVGLALPSARTQAVHRAEALAVVQHSVTAANDYISQLVQAARVLHDEPQADLWSARAAIAALQEDAPDDLQPLLEQAHTAVEAALDHVRNAVSFNEGDFLALGLARKLHDWINRNRSVLPAVVKTQIEVGQMPGRTGMNAYLFVTEALGNVMKHARAHSVEITIIQQGKDLTISIVDDGCGGAGENPPHSLRVREALSNGKITTFSSPVRFGTRIEATLPAI